MTVSPSYDAIVIGSGIGGLVTATQLVSKGLKVLVLERYLIPGGSAGYFEREGYRFDVGASMIFGFGDRGTTNLLTRALAAVGQALETLPDPVQIHYHLPGGLDPKVHREYEASRVGGEQLAVAQQAPALHPRSDLRRKTGRHTHEMPASNSFCIRRRSVPSGSTKAAIVPPHSCSSGAWMRG